jgi:hypothetical protein
MLSPRRIGVRALLVAASLSGCATVDYVGNSYPPTAQVDVYMAASDVTRPYQVIGEVRAQVEALPLTKPGQQLQDKIVAEAKARGANGVILGGVTSREVASTTQTSGQGTSKKKGSGKRNANWSETSQTNVDEVTELRGQLIRYTAQ